MKQGGRLKQSTKLQRRPLVSKRKVTGEGKVFKDVEKYYNNHCMLTNVEILYPTPTSFPHLLSKGMYPKLRLYPNNIGFVRPDLHETVDEIIGILKKRMGTKVLEEMIKSGEYITDLIREEYRLM